MGMIVGNAGPAASPWTQPTAFPKMVAKIKGVYSLAMRDEREVLTSGALLDLQSTVALMRALQEDGALSSSPKGALLAKEILAALNDVDREKPGHRSLRQRTLARELRQIAAKFGSVPHFCAEH